MAFENFLLMHTLFTRGMPTAIWTDRHTDRQTHRQTDRQTHRQTSIQRNLSEFYKYSQRPLDNIATNNLICWDLPGPALVCQDMILFFTSFRNMQKTSFLFFIFIEWVICLWIFFASNSDRWTLSFDMIVATDATFTFCAGHSTAISRRIAFCEGVHCWRWDGVSSSSDVPIFNLLTDIIFRQRRTSFMAND